MTEECLRVAVRVRPLIPSEVARGCQNCISVVPGEPQIQLTGTDKAFTYNFVFGSDVGQDDVYDTAVKDMMQNIFKGYNVTILAYGQTGSGKTYSMGTNYSFTNDLSTGIIPRAVGDIFSTISQKTLDNWTYKVTVGFMELYNEQLYDLLADKPTRKDSIVDIREDTNGIKIIGLTEREVTCAEQVLQCLMSGSQGRATGATAMNSQSSRSHAIFTLTVCQQKNNDSNSATTSKFHLVDLAGSERSKKTQATGDRFKEGVSINKGLLALGNVISNLGDNAVHIGYRDSKLTRLLQDSLGGNSITLMIACVSPADYNFEETLSTLRYADRAKKIKNKPIVNQDPKAAEINRLNAIVKELKLSLIERAPAINCPPEHQELVEKNKGLQKKLRELSEQLNCNLMEFMGMHERAEIAETSREKLRQEIDKLLDDIQAAINETNIEQVLLKLKNIQDKILKIQEYQKKSDAEIIHQISLEDNPNVKDASINSTLNESSLDEEHTEHTLLQAARNKEVTNINRQLALKEQLVAKLLLNSSQLEHEHDKEMDMENEIKALQAEKEQLLKNLEDVQANNTSAKLAEARRKKVKELEKKITELTKKYVEQSRILKSKEKAVEQVKNLTQEIHSMKQMRVKLVRDMRKEADKFQQYKALREREVYKLKDQDRKRKNQIERLQILHNKQQSVMKRKMEEAYAMNKKLKETLALQKKIRASREEKGKKSKDYIQRLVNHEVAVIQETIDAQNALDMQLKYREKIAENLNHLKATAEQNPSDYLTREINDLGEYLDLCTIKIQHMQQEIVASDQENMVKSRLEGIHTIGEVKQVCQYLFEWIGQIHKQRKLELSEGQDKYDELMMAHDAVLTKLKKIELTPCVSLEEHRQVLEELDMYKRMNIQVKKEEEEDGHGGGVGGNKDEKMSNASKSRTAPRKTMCVRPTVLDKFVGDLGKENCETDESFNDDPDKDPDWVRTPLAKRWKSIGNVKRFPHSTEGKGTKRSSADSAEDTCLRCQCKTKCQNHHCKCQKNGAMCSEECGCNPAKCENRNNGQITRYFDEGPNELAGPVKKIRTE
ncbi:chromosome-associated kinesin KIF4 [Diachasma alloeum]|uniref:chromosome-associated kinesin KIF4 n=1 Tax=Diachasma alloeum TaxID=454923 RepID=UPI00073840A7|nr:chromosome-associated kinesin KIF4 [Diachasma alloeum]XP_015113939.1 chromosome-associated kinesin KIF4 [Diachasma alloeum]